VIEGRFAFKEGVIGEREYRRKDERGIPMSVRERYENELTEMWHQIREARNGKTGKRLGELLVEQGVLDQ
jgi:hypothetical protein